MQKGETLRQELLLFVIHEEQIIKSFSLKVHWEDVMGKSALLLCGSLEVKSFHWGEDLGK